MKNELENSTAQAPGAQVAADTRRACCGDVVFDRDGISANHKKLTRRVHRSSVKLSAMGIANSNQASASRAGSSQVKPVRIRASGPGLLVRLPAVVLVILLLAAGFRAACADGGYIITELGLLDGHTRSEPVAINDQGHVLVNSWKVGTREYGSFLYRDGVRVDLGTMGFEGCIAADLNNADQAAGYCFRPDPRNNGLDVQHAFLYSGGSMFDIGTSSPFWQNSASLGLNGLGHVVGHETDGTNNYAFFYRDGQLRHLADATGVLTNYAALAVNDSDQIVVAREGTLFIHQGGTLTALDIPGTGARVPRAINARGEVAGWYEIRGTPGIPPDPGHGHSFTVRHAFLYAGGKSTDLGSLGAQESIAMGLNLHGQVVGAAISFATNRPIGYHAVLFQEGNVFDLNDLVATNSGWLLQTAVDINDLGQIVCIGVSNGTRALLLTPPFLRLDPQNGTNRLGEEHVVICTAVSNGVPVVGLTLDFSVTSGPNAGKDTAKATLVTDASGQSTFRYTGKDLVGVDVIEARGTMGKLPVATTALQTWVGGIELNPRIIIGCPGQVKDLEVYDLMGGKNIASDPSVTFEWIGKGKLEALLLAGLEKLAPQVKGKRATITVDKGQITFGTEGVNVLQARRKTDQGEILSNYALVVSGQFQVNEVTSIKIAPDSLINTPGSIAADKITSLLGKELPFSAPMILFPKEEKPCGGILQKLGNYGFVELKSVQFSLFGGLIEDVDMMQVVQPLVGLIGDVLTLGTFGKALSTRLVNVTAAQLLDYKVSDEARDPSVKNPFIEVASDHSSFPYIKGIVTAKKSGVALVQATLNLEKYCMGKATDLMWVWVLPDLDKVDIRNEQGRVARDAQKKELPIDVLVNQSTQPRAVGVFKGFADTAPISIEWDPIGAKDSQVLAMAEKLLPKSVDLRDRIGVPVDLQYPTGPGFGTNGVYEGGETAVRFKVTYLPLRPAIRIDDLKLQTGLSDFFNTWSIQPADTPNLIFDDATGKMTGISPGTADLHLDVCVLGLSKGSDEAPVRVVAGDASCIVTPQSQSLTVGETTALAVSVEVGGLPVSGAKVDIIVMSGPNAGKSGSDWSPGAGFSYVGDGGPGTDSIEITGFAWNKIFHCTATRTWAASKVDCSMSPAEQTLPADLVHTVKARVTANQVPVAGVTVNFVVAEGPNQGVGRSVVTDDNGIAPFAYAGGGEAGTDRIQAIGVHENAPFGCAATCVWTPLVVNCTVNPATQTLPVESAETVTATVTLNNLAAPGVLVSFAVTDGPNKGAGRSVVTDGAGQATFAYVGSGGAGTDTIQAIGVHRNKPFQCGAVVVWTDTTKKSDLSVTMSAAPDPARVGGTLTYTLVVRNSGPDKASNVSLTDSLPAEVNWVSTSTSQGGCSGTRTIDCEFGDLALGASATVTLAVIPSKAGQVSNTAHVSAGGTDPNPGNNTATVVVLVAGTDLSISKTHTPDSVYPGQNLSFQLGVRNPGPGRATGVTVTDSLPGGVRFMSAAPSQGSVAGTGSVLWSVGVLEEGATATATIVVRPAVAGRLINTATVAGAEPDPATGNNTALDSFLVRSGPLVSLITPSAVHALDDFIDLKIEGVGFAPGAVLTFEPAAGIEVEPVDPPDFGFVSPGELQRWIFIDAGATPGIREVFVTNPDGGSGGGWPQGVFTILAKTQTLPLPKGVTFWLTGDGSAADLVGRRNGTLLNGATASSRGQVGNAFFLDGIDDAVEVASAPSINGSGKDLMTIEGWFKRTGIGTAMSLVAKRRGCTPSDVQYELRWNLQDGVVFAAGDASAVSQTELPLNIWTHVAGVSDGSTVSVYVDGYWACDAPGVLGPALADPLRIGGTAACDDRFQGWVDELTVYDRALSEDEILSIAAAGSTGKNKLLLPYVVSAVPTADGRSIQISWPSSGVDYVVEETAALPGGAGWTTVLQPPVLAGDHYGVTLNPGDAVRFYRLRQRQP